MAEQAELSGCERAAIFLMSLGEQNAAKVMKLIDVRDVQKLSQTMTTLGSVTREHADQVLSEFTQSLENEAPLAVGSQPFLKRLLSKSLGAEQANPLVDRLFADQNNALASLQLMELTEVAAAIQSEHPQVVAITLAGLEADKAAQILTELPISMAAQVITRIARMEEIPQGALEEIDEVMQKKFSQGDRHKAKTMGGLRSAAEILNMADKDVETAILEEFGKDDEALCQQVQESMFVFESLEDIDDRGIQALVRELDSNTLVTALKGASSALRDLIVRNMSKRAGAMLQSDIEAKGPVRISEVEEAQKSIVAIVRNLANEGTLILGNTADEYL